MEHETGVINKIAEDGIYGYIRTGAEADRFFTFRKMVPERSRPFTAGERCQLIGARVRFKPMPPRAQGEAPRAVEVEVI